MTLEQVLQKAVIALRWCEIDPLAVFYYNVVMIIIVELVATRVSHCLAQPDPKYVTDREIFRTLNIYLLNRSSISRLYSLDYLYMIMTILIIALYRTYLVQCTQGNGLH